MKGLKTRSWKNFLKSRQDLSPDSILMKIAAMPTDLVASTDHLLKTGYLIAESHASSKISSKSHLAECLLDFGCFESISTAWLRTSFRSQEEFLSCLGNVSLSNCKIITSAERSTLSSRTRKVRMSWSSISYTGWKPWTATKTLLFHISRRWTNKTLKTI
jgi:hypothetical protein